MTDRGIIYYATGTKYINQALRSAESLKKHNNLPVTIYSDREIDSPYVDNVIAISSSEYPFYDRINYFKQTPYPKTLYLDTDTYIVGDIGPVFDMLDRFEVVAAFNESRDTAASHTKFDTLDLDVPETFPEYQCGVIGYKNTGPIQDLLNDWQTRYEPYKTSHVLDQPHFREALFNNEVAIGTLPTEYNVLLNFSGYLHSTPKLLHYGGTNRPFLGDGTPTVEVLEETADRLSANAPQNRVFFSNAAGNLQVVLGHGDPGFLTRVVTHVRTNGFKQTLIKGVRKLSRMLC